MAKPRDNTRKSALRRYRQRGGAGAPPGQIDLPPEAKQSKVRLLSYDSDELVQIENCSIDQIRDELGKRTVTWIDIIGLGTQELYQQIGDLFDIHRLALSDVAHAPQRPKVDSYADHIFLIAQVPMHGNDGATGQVSFFLGKNYVISWQEFPGRGFAAVQERLQDSTRAIRSSGPDYLFYALLDSVIDASFPTLMHLGDKLDTLEERIYDRAETQVITQLHRVRRRVRHLRSVMWPLREAVNSLIVSHDKLISAEVRIYLRDCYDHTFQLLDTLEIYRETCSDLRDYYSTEVSNRMNEVMKVLTIIATIFIPLSFIAGVYGMNFDPEISEANMPELKWRWGYPLVLGIMATVAIGQLAFFRWRGWLGKPQKGKRAKSK